MNLFKTRSCDFRNIFCIVHRARFWQSFYKLEKLFTVRLIMQGSKPYKNPCNTQLRRISGGEDWEGVTVMVRIRVLSRETYADQKDCGTCNMFSRNSDEHPRHFKWNSSPWALARLPFHFKIPGYRVIMQSCNQFKPQLTVMRLGKGCGNEVWGNVMRWKSKTSLQLASASVRIISKVARWG